MSGFYGFRNIARQRLAYNKNIYYVRYVSLFFVFSSLTIPYIALSISPMSIIFLKKFYIFYFLVYLIYHIKVLNSIPDKEIDIETAKITSPNEFYGKLSKIKGGKAILIFFIPAIIIFLLTLFLL